METAKTDKSDTKKVTVELSQASIDALKELADSQGITANAALNQAIATRDLIEKEIQGKKAKVLIQEPNGVTKQLVFG